MYLDWMYQKMDIQPPADAICHKEMKFDLNTEEVLNHWKPEDAIREIFVNALDETYLSECEQLPELSLAVQDADASTNVDVYHIRDYGRGFKYQNLSQNENTEKKQKYNDNNGEIVGQFGVGLNDVLVVLNNNNIDVCIKSKYHDITFEKTAKEGFKDVITLHGIIHPPSEPHIVGTRFIIKGII